MNEEKKSEKNNVGKKGEAKGRHKWHHAFGMIQSMSVVIIGGHDRMVCQYKKICKEYHCKAKVFTQMSAKLKDQIGSPDLVILFTNTVSHKMARCAVSEAERCHADVVRCHTSSQSALSEILGKACGMALAR